MAEARMYLNAWNAQRIVYELVLNHLRTNDPATLGYSFKQRYDPEVTKTGIYVQNAFHWDAGKVNGKPAIFVSRQDLIFSNRPVIGQNSSFDVVTGEQHRFRTSNLPLKVSVLAANLGLTELLADYLKQAFLYPALEIKRDFCLRDFSLKAILAPRLFTEARDYFQVDMILSMVYDESWAVTKESMRLKSISWDIFDQVQEAAEAV